MCFVSFCFVSLFGKAKRENETKRLKNRKKTKKERKKEGRKGKERDIKAFLFRAFAKKNLRGRKSRRKAPGKGTSSYISSFGCGWDLLNDDNALAANFFFFNKSKVFSHLSSLTFYLGSKLVPDFFLFAIRTHFFFFLSNVFTQECKMK